MKLKDTLHFNAMKFTQFFYLLIVIIIALVALVSDIVILSQAVRSAPNKDWTRNGNVFAIGVLVVSPLLHCILTVAKAPNARRGPTRHLTSFLPQTSAVGALEVGEDTKRAHCDGNGRSSKGMSFADSLETCYAFG